jgi:hypothetical protein
MRYRSVLFTVPVSEQRDDDPREWARRELTFEALLDALRSASRPAVHVGTASEPEPPEGS